MNKRLIILLIVVAVLVTLYFVAQSMGWLEIINPEQIFNTRDTIKEWADDNFLVVAVVFVLVYFIAIAVSFPGASFLTLTGGFLFGPVLSTFLVNIGASAGAIVIFLAARYFLGDAVQNKYADKLEKFNKEMEANGSNYLLTLRFIPLFPFFLINLLSGLTKVKLGTFAWTTIFGILPGSFVYSYAGASLTSIEPGESILTTEIIIALVLLGIISLIPVVYRKIQTRKTPTEPS